MRNADIGIIIGAAFGTIVASLVNDVIMPPIGLLLGGVDFANLFILLKAGSPAAPYASLADAQAAGAVTINYGVFIKGGRRGDNQLRRVHQRRRQLPHRRLCDLPADPQHQPDEAGRGSTARRTDNERVPILPVHHPDQGHPLRVLHL
jgi:hypothetical protein